jgi:glycosyltransferase involved in cell wall biosynthesis
LTATEAPTPFVRPRRRETPVRVLQVLTCDALGGTELMVASLVERLEPSEVQATVASLDTEGPVSRRLRRAGFEFHSLGGRGTLATLAHLARLLRRGRFDVVNAYGLKASMAARFLAAVLAPSAAVVVGVRGLHVTDVENPHGLRGRAILAFERLTSRLVAVYDANSLGAVELLTRSGIDPRRVRYIPNGVDPSGWPAAHRSDRVGTPTVICVARFTRLKRHQDVLAALARIRERGVQFRAVFVGDGPTRAASVGMASELGLGQVVKFPGMLSREQVREQLADADVFCLASLWEGMPGSVMEAMMASLPVVGTDVNGIRDLVAEGVTGLLVPPRDPPALANALDRLLEDRQLRLRMGAAGRDRVLRGFSIERMVAEKQRLYLAVAGAL